MNKLTTIKNNQTILENDKITKFFSYNTLIATINKNKQNNNLEFTNYWNYSQTTLKYLYQFLEMYKSRLANNIYTKVINALDCTNKKASLQTLIDAKIIKLAKN